MDSTKKNRYIVLDTETTGLFLNKNDRIIEIGCVEIIENQITGENFQVYINPEKQMDQETIAVHKITNEFLQDKKTFKNIYEDFLNYLKKEDYSDYNNYIVAHNASFDMKFLNYEFSKLSISNAFEDFVVIDTLPIAKKFNNGQSANLDAICTRLGIDLENRKRLGHGALLDAKLLAEVFIVFLQQNLVVIKSGNRINKIIKRATVLKPRVFDNYQEDEELHISFFNKITSNI